jgi:hypothetical protein
VVKKLRDRIEQRATAFYFSVNTFLPYSIEARKKAGVVDEVLHQILSFRVEGVDKGIGKGNVADVPRDESGSDECGSDDPPSSWSVSKGCASRGRLRRDYFAKRHRKDS